MMGVYDVGKYLLNRLFFLMGSFLLVECNLALLESASAMRGAGLVLKDRDGGDVIAK